MKRSRNKSWLATVFVASGITVLISLSPQARGQGETEALPAGPGFAAQYPGDEGLERDPRVLFVEDFESGTLRELGDRWGNATQPENLIFSF